MDLRSKNNILNQQAKLDKEFRASQTLTSLKYNPYQTTIVIPKEYRPKGENVFNCSNTHKCALLIMRCLSAAAYTIYQTDEASKSVPKGYADRVPTFAAWLNECEILDENQAEVIKRFEEYRVNIEGCTPQGSFATNIISFLMTGIALKEFYEVLSDTEICLLDTLISTKLAPRSTPKQFTLSNWFAPHSWLRLEDVGIGNELFNYLASPKELIKSFSVTCASALLYLIKQKHQLVNLIKVNKIKSNDLNISYNYVNKRTNLAHHHAHILNVLNKHYTTEANDALMSVAHCFTYKESRKQVLNSLGNNKLIAPYTNNKTVTATIESCSPFLNIDTLIDLCKYVESDAPEDYIPMTEAEYWLFSWLMAWQMIQATDIPKLTLRNFRFLRKNNGTVTHIECEYYKSRAKVEHTPPMLEATSVQGEAIYSFIRDKTNNFSKSSNDMSLVPKRKSCDFPTSENSSLGKLFSLLQTENFRRIIDASLSENKATPVFINALEKLQNNGIEHDDNKLSREEYIETTELTVPALVFGASHIKTSAVHARSDRFNPSQLVNYNSHSNKTERESYLTPENEEWMNNCGRITRAVMQDLVTNVLRPSNELEFNSEFTRAKDCIESRSTDSLIRMKLITDVPNGAIADDLGRVTDKEFVDPLPGTLYVLDAPETVMQYKHYLSEAKKNYKKLVKSAPEFLLFTVCPTCEWIESLFDQKRFSKSSIKQGEQLFQQYGKHLPKLFAAQIRG